MVGLDGEKMSKSRGNLVLVSKLRADGRRPDGDPAGAARAPLPHRLGLDRPTCSTPQARLERWRAALSVNGGADADGTIAAVRAALADDLDTPRRSPPSTPGPSAPWPGSGDVEGAPGLVAAHRRRPARRPPLSRPARSAAGG